MLPYGRQYIDEEDIQAVASVLRGDWLTTGPSVAEFERLIEEISGGYRAVSATSGTAALHMAYAGAGVGPGTEVITTPMTFIATAATASILGAKIKFADVTPDTGLIDASKVAELISDKTAILAAVDYAGHPADYDALQALAEPVGAKVLADAAHSIGGTYRGRPVGALADITAFSFFPTKNLTTGEGGAVVAKDPNTAQRVRDFHDIGLVRNPDKFLVTDQGGWHQEVHNFGLNYRLSDVASALGISQLGKLARFKQRRREIVDRYNAALAGIDAIRLPVQHDATDPMWHLYSIGVRHGRRREVYDFMRSKGIGVQVNYIPVYWHPVYQNHGYKRGLCPIAENFYEEQLSLPLHPSLSDADVDKVIDILQKAVK